MKIKRRIVIILSAALFLLPIQAAAEFSVRYQDGELSYAGSCGAEYVKVVIAPRGLALAELSDDEVNRRTDVFITSVFTDPGGTFSAEGIGLSALPEATYIASANSQHCCEERIFVKSDAGVLATVASAFLSSDDPYRLIESNLDGLGFDSEVFRQYGNEIIKLLKFYAAHNPLNLSFDQSYLLCENIVLMKNNRISVADLLMLCYDFTGIDYDEDYQEYPDKIRTELEKTAKKQDYSGKRFQETYRDAPLLAQANVLGADMSTAVLAYCKENNVDMSRFNLLSQYEQSLVFNDMAVAAPFDYVQELLTAFDEAVEKQLDGRGSAERPSHSSGGGGGGSQAAYTVKDDGGQQQPEPLSFYDIQGHWAERAICAMAEAGIVNGYADGGFHPEAFVTRAEFVKMLVEMLDVSSPGGQRFADVAPGAWFYPYVYAAADCGLVKGVADDRFAPDVHITRENVAVILHRVLTGRDTPLTESKDFADADQISGYAKDAVAQLAGVGIIEGADGYFLPQGDLSRAEAATLLYRVSNFLS